MLDSLHHRVAVLPESEQFTRSAMRLSELLGLPILATGDNAEINKYPVVLWVGAAGLGLKQTGKNSPNPVQVDFLEGSMAYRNRNKANARELIVKAVGVKQNQDLKVLDATAGLGRDAFILAAFGCDVQLLERSPIIFLLLQDGMRRAEGDPDIAPIVARMRVLQVEALSYLNRLVVDQNTPDVIYLDPMFPGRLKSAKVKKEMQVLQLLLTDNPDDQALLKTAIDIAKKRVVVKRPRLADFLHNCTPSFSITGRSSRFDVYQTFKENQAGISG